MNVTLIQTDILIQYSRVRNQVTIDYEEAGHLMKNLDWHGAVKDIQGAAQYLLKQGCTKVGVTGFCMGGALSFAAAALVPEISAAAPFYGIPSADLCDVLTIKTPLQCHFGELDTVIGFSSPQDYEPLREKLQHAGVPMQFYTYPAGHAFSDETGSKYHKKSKELAFQRLNSFMKEKLA